jgi:hypothetical protein
VLPAESSRLRQILDCHIVYRARESPLTYSVTAYQSFSQVTLESARTRYCDRPRTRGMGTRKCRNTCPTFGILLKEAPVTTAIGSECLDFSAKTVWPTNCLKSCIPLYAALCKARKVTNMLFPDSWDLPELHRSAVALKHAIRFEAAMESRVAEAPGFRGTDYGEALSVRSGICSRSFFRRAMECA